MSASSYHKPTYWSARYESEDAEYTFDWYHRYDGDLRNFVQDEIPKTGSILTIGCGNSLMPEAMRQDGYDDLVCTDVAENVIKRMQHRCRDMAGLRFEAMDARKLTYDDASFDAVIDKGTIDAIDMGPTNVLEVCAEALRVLKPGGKFLVFSVDPPIVRTFYFKKPQFNWTVEEHVLKNELGAPCYAFVMTKGE